MTVLSEIFEKNKKWSEKISGEDKDFFVNLAKGQKPEYLWIGCCDSRVPASQVCGFRPGELFVHRNIANVVNSADFNCLSVLQYAVEVLKVKHIIVCGHYGCGGVNAALENTSLGLIDNWLKHIRSVYQANKNELDAILDLHKKQERLAELNVAAQVTSVCQTAIVKGAWSRKQQLSVHGLIYRLDSGLLVDLEVSTSDV